MPLFHLRSFSVRWVCGESGVGPGTSAYTSVKVPPRSMQKRKGRLVLDALFGSGTEVVSSSLKDPARTTTRRWALPCATNIDVSAASTRLVPLPKPLRAPSFLVSRVCDPHRASPRRATETSAEVEAIADAEAHLIGGGTARKSVTRNVIDILFSQAGGSPWGTRVGSILRQTLCNLARW